MQFNVEHHVNPDAERLIEDKTIIQYVEAVVERTVVVEQVTETEIDPTSGESQDVTRDVERMVEKVVEPAGWSLTRMVVTVYTERRQERTATTELAATAVEALAAAEALPALLDVAVNRRIQIASRDLARARADGVRI